MPPALTAAILNEGGWLTWPMTLGFALVAIQATRFWASGQTFEQFSSTQ